MAVLLAFLLGATARLFVWPADDSPQRVDALVLLAGPAEPTSAAIQLARTYHPGFLLVSQGHEGYGGPCPPPVPRVRLICFDPEPATTQGEAEYAARVARTHRWHSIMVVTITPHEWRARQLLQRCFNGSVYAAGTGIPWSSWPYQIAYEWAATIKMLASERGC